MIKKLREREGFTLAELLIVVAIIAVLVAIAIPVFNSQLEKSRDAVTVSNIRAAYAQAQTAYLTKESDAANKVTYNKTAKTVAVENVEAKGTSGEFGTTGDELKKTLNGVALPEDMGHIPGTYTVTFFYGDDDKISKIEAQITSTDD